MSRRPAQSWGRYRTLCYWASNRSVFNYFLRAYYFRTFSVWENSKKSQILIDILIYDTSTTCFSGEWNLLFKLSPYTERAKSNKCPNNEETHPPSGKSTQFNHSTNLKLNQAYLTVTDSNGSVLSEHNLFLFGHLVTAMLFVSVMLLIQYWWQILRCWWRNKYVSDIPIGRQHHNMPECDVSDRNLIFVPCSWCWRRDLSPTSQTGHQHNESLTSVINIEIQPTSNPLWNSNLMFWAISQIVSG